MSIIRDFVNLFGCITELTFLYFYFDAFAEKRKIPAGLRLLFAGVSFASLFVGIYVIDVIYIKSIVLLCIVLIFSFGFDCSFLKRMYLLVTSFAFFSAAEVITGMISIAILKKTIYEIRESDVAYIVNILASQFLILIMLKFILIYMKNKNKKLDKKSEIAMILVMIPIVFSIFLMGEVATEYSVKRNILAVALTVLTFTTSTVTFYLTERQMKLKEYEVEIKELENQYDSQVRNYENLREKTRDANKTIHDIKNFTLAISSYLEQGKIDEARKRLAEYSESISAVTKHSCGNRTVDALLAAKKKEIDGVCADNHMSVVLNDFIDEYEIDFCILIGNAIDNAIEESRRIEDRNGRYIEIRIIPNSGGMSVFVRNKTNGHLAARGKTSKDSELFHGFGIENMKSICEKHNGDFKISEHDGLFDLSIFLPNIQEI